MRFLQKILFNVKANYFFRNYSPCNAPANKICSQSRYRTLDGSCNNLKYQFWGAAMQRYNRLLPPSYEDGISSPTVSITGKVCKNMKLKV